MLNSKTTSTNTDQPPSKRWRWLAVPCVLGLMSLLTAGYFITFTQATVLDGADKLPIRTHQRTVEAALREASIQLLPEDRVEPALDAPLVNGQQIVIHRARMVRVHIGNQEAKLIRTQRLTGSELLADLGHRLGVNDFVSINGGANGTHIFAESNYDDNTATVQVTVPRR